MPSVTPSSLTRQTYEAIRDRILTRKYSSGERLITQSLADELGTSLTPVREALRFLEKDGLIEFAPYRGAVVSRPSAEIFTQTFEVREALEGMAASLAAQRHGKVELESIRHWLDRGGKASGSRMFLESDEHFHHAIAQASGNALLVKSLDEIRVKIRTFWALTVDESKGFGRGLAEHRAIYDAIRSRSSEESEKRMRQHIRRSFLEAEWKQPTPR